MWFKRDLRMLDHAPLSDGCENGKILPLYILEPSLWKQPDVSYRHFLYLQHYVSQLDEMFIKKGSRLVIKVGEALPVLKSLANRHNIKKIFSHYETWNKFSKDRDAAIRKWTEKNSISNLSWRNSTVKGYASIINQKTKIGPNQLLVFFLNFRNSNLNIFILFWYL